MDALSVDFETASECDLIACGAYKYAQDPSTKVLMMSWAFGDEPVELWWPWEPFPKRVIQHIKRGGVIKAFNASFERLIFWYVLCPDFNIPEPKLEQFQCTAARARAHGLPGKLADCARAMNLPLQKMEEGKRLIDTYCAPGHIELVRGSDDQILFGEYCKTDTGVERMIGDCLRELTEEEWYEYHLNEINNDRGVPIDTEMAHAAFQYAADVRDDVNAKVLELTGGFVKTARQIKNRDIWLRERLTEEQLECLMTAKGKIGFDQDKRDELRAFEDLDDDVFDYTDLVDEAGGATVGKYKTLIHQQMDDRVYGALQWNGAGQTGRFSSLKPQWHNMRRDGFEDHEERDQLIADVKEGFEIDDVTVTLARLIRSVVYRKKGLRWFDWSAIEGRIAPWLADSPAGRQKLQLYIEGVDPYIYNASRTLGIPMEAVDKGQRQAGKVQELSMQFLGGVRALITMGRKLGVRFTHDEAEAARDGWREANPWAQEIGNKMNSAAYQAVRHPGTEYPAGRVSFVYDGADWLWMILPSGRPLAYFQPRIEEVETPWGEKRNAVTCLWGSKRPKKGAPWPRRAMHAGIWLENGTQAVGADLLREALIRCDDQYIDVVLSTHDEILAEGEDHEELGRVMLTPPLWADGLPLDGEGGHGVRYGK